MSADPAPRTIIRLGKVLLCTGLSRTMLYSLIAIEQFPGQVRLGARAVGWFEYEVQAWIVGRQAQKANLSHRAAQKHTSKPSAEDEDRRLNSALVNRTIVSLSQKSNRKSFVAPCPTIPEQTDAELAPVVKPVKHGRPEKPQVVRASNPGLPEGSVHATDINRLIEENRRLKELLADLILHNADLESTIRNHSVRA